MKIFVLTLITGWLLTTLPAQVRREYSISDGWKFKQGGWAYAEMERFDDRKWETVSLPHTWNATDPFDHDKAIRIFDVAINNQLLSKNFDMVATAGFAQAIRKTFVIQVNDKQGINISFNAIKGGAALNGVQVRKLQ